MEEWFQLSSNDCLSINGLYVSCMSGLLASNHPGSIQPSPPAYSSNENWKSMLDLLQIVADDLHHVYDVHGRCLDA